VQERFQFSVAGTVPTDRWKEPAGPGGASIAWLLFHTTFHEDLAVNAVIRNTPITLTTARAELGLAAFPSFSGLGETEQPELTSALDLAALATYAHDVHSTTQTWLAGVESEEFGSLLATTDAAGPVGLDRAGIAEADVPWLYRMWDGKPPSFFLQWEAIGHRINHVGEMVSVRNRLGLSPF